MCVLTLIFHLSWYVQVREYLERFDSIPDLLELDHLTVSGDVTFGKGVSLKVLCDGTYHCVYSV